MVPKILFFLLMTPMLLAGSKGFVDMSYKDALAKARKENKYVFIDFYATWCGPCKRMDRTTFRDPNVIEKMRTEAVSLKIDGEDQVTLAEKFDVKVYPTLLWLNGDGSIAFRSDGAMNAEEMLESFKMLKEGRDPLSEKLAALNKTPNDVRANLDYFHALLSAGKKDGAFDHIMAMAKKHREGSIPQFTPPSTYFFMGRIKSEKSLKYMEREAGRILKDINAGNIDEGNLEAYGALVVALRKKHGGPTLLALYDNLKSEGKVEVSKLEPFHDLIFDDLRKAKRYKDIVAIKPLEERSADADAFYKKLKEMGNGKMASSMYLRKRTDLYEIMLGLNKMDDAQKLAAAIIEADPENYRVYNGLAWCGHLAGKSTPQTLKWAQKAYADPKGHNAAVLDTVARVMSDLGQTGDAIKMVQEAIKNEKKEGREMIYLKECLSYLENLDKEASQG